MILTPINNISADSIIERLKYNIEPAGDKDGVNLVYTTPDYFLQDSLSTIRIYRNGQRLSEGSGNDYTVSESGGVGTGYDTITITEDALLSDEALIVDYVVA
jgi:hypothetical protein